MENVVFPPLKIGKAIYVASRASVSERPAMWKQLRDVDGWPITSTWIDEAGAGETADLSELWQRIHVEILNSAGLILYATAFDFPLKGAFVEAGIALGLGHPVAVVFPDFELTPGNEARIGSWINHPNVKVFSNVWEARAWINRFAPGPVEDHCPACGSAECLHVNPAKNAAWCSHCDAEFITTEGAMTRTRNAMFDC